MRISNFFALLCPFFGERRIYCIKNATLHFLYLPYVAYYKYHMVNFLSVCFLKRIRFHGYV
jgi:hypothetical protein